MQRRALGVCLDIDGVLLRGKTVLAGARESLLRLHAAGVPFLFMTNGGGMLEADKLAELRARLRLPGEADAALHAGHMLLSHTPMRALAPRMHEDKVLIFGSQDYVRVARAYGLKNVLTPQQIHAEVPELYPFRAPDPDLVHAAKDHPDGPVQGIMVLHDPVDWALEMQIFCDAIAQHTERRRAETGSGPGTVTTSTATAGSASTRIPATEDQQHIPVFVSNGDFVFSGQHHAPRFAAGAFVQAASGLFESLYGHKVQIQQYGKPSLATYRWAEEMLKDLADEMNVPRPEHFYGIGDNPRADIRGANNAGDHWTSVLVRTGLFRGDGDGNDEEDPADIVVQGVEDAVEEILKLHGLT